MSFRLESTSLSAHQRIALAAELAAADWTLPDRVLWPMPDGSRFARLERQGEAGETGQAGRWSAEIDRERLILPGLVAPDPLLEPEANGGTELVLHYCGHRHADEESFCAELARFAGRLSRSDYALIVTATWGGADPEGPFEPELFGLPRIKLMSGPAGHHVLRQITVWHFAGKRPYRPLADLAARCRAVLAAR